MTNLLIKAKKDEMKAPNEYRKLMKHLSPTDKIKIIRIISDEQTHLRILNTIKSYR